jgi:hypothetical protein
LNHLEDKNKGLQEHLIGLKFNMEDQKMQCVEAKERVQIAN